MELLTGLIIFLFGIVTGSFLNVCILRIPEGKEIVKEPSHCMTCKKRLVWYELIPIASWLCLGGRCSKCKAKISPQYPLVEAGNGILWLLVFWRFGLTPIGALSCLLVSTLLVVALIDARTMEIPPALNWVILALGALAMLFDLANWAEHLIGFFAISLPLYLIFLATRGRGIGGGDIKLMAVCGLFLGWKLILLGFFLGCAVGSVVHLLRMRFAKAGRVLALGPYLALGVTFALLEGKQIIDWYLTQFM